MALDRRLWAPLILGVGGVLILAMLAIWQVQRLGWKTAMIDALSARADAPPVPVPPSPDAAVDRFLRVTAEGTYDHAGERFVLTTRKPEGPGFQLITPLALPDGRRILVQRGYIAEALRDPALRPQSQPVTTRVTGLLRWPNEVGFFTPPADGDLWFARDVPGLAAALGTEPVLIQAQDEDPAHWPDAAPPGIELPNDHLEYAITWSSLAVVWAGMAFLWGRRRLASG